MNWRKIIKYVYFIILIWTTPFIVDFIFENLGGDKGNPMFFTISFLFFVINILFVNTVAEFPWWKKIIFALVNIILSISLSVLTTRLNIFPVYDQYGIITWIFGNGIFMVILWEIIFRLRI